MGATAIDHVRGLEAGERHPVRPLVAVLAVLTVAVLGVAFYWNSPAHRLHDPVHALQQFDLFYLDETAPFAEQLGLQVGRPAVVVVCQDCQSPDVDAQVRSTADVAVARAYGLLTTVGRVGPGYAVVDSAGQLRYRTFDPAPAAHVEEIQVLVEAAR